MPDQLVSAEEVLNHPDWRLFDCRFSLADAEAGFSQFQSGHLPGAVYAHLDKDLSSPVGNTTGRHPLPDRGKLAKQFRQWGINQFSQLVCYDDGNGAFAGRLWWLARWLGHKQVAVLDGGLKAWVEAGGQMTGEAQSFPEGDFTVSEPLTRSIEAEDLSAEHQIIVDARDAPRFRGEVEPIDPVAGHIPGAVNAPFPNNMHEGKFKSADTLQVQFNALGIGSEDEVVCYCGSGVTAIHNILAMKLAGLPEPALYGGSWSEWITNPDHPVATGE